MSAFAGMFLLCFSSQVLALQKDADQLADFVADAVSFNNNDGTTIYTGHVRMQQGTTHLVANRVVVYKDKNGNMNQVIATGNPAHYTTLPDGQKKVLDAFGKTIEYYPQKQIAVIVGDGHVIQKMNSLHGPRIVYDMVQQTVKVVPSAVHEDEKSLIVLQPQDLPGK